SRRSNSSTVSTIRRSNDSTFPERHCEEAKQNFREVQTLPPTWQSLCLLFNRRTDELWNRCPGASLREGETALSVSTRLCRRRGNLLMGKRSPTGGLPRNT